MKAIIAMSSNRCIGRDGKLPFYYKEDLKWFKEFTLYNTILIGRTTYEGLPPLKDRKLIKKVIKITNYTTIFKTNLKLLTISLKTPEMTNNVSHSPCQT